MKIKNRYIFFILIFLCLPALWGIFHSGLFVADDISSMVIRLSSFYEAFASGQFPVRMLPRLNQGLGYPVADFLYPLFLYIGAGIHFLKIPFVLDIKIILGASIVGSGIGMYVFLRKHFSSLPSLVGSLVYVYAPYHLYDVYSRGSVGEVLALCIVPFLFWAIEKKSWVMSSVFVGLLILSHNTLALFFLPIAILYALLRKIRVLHILFIICFGLSLSAFFWLPALFDKQFTIFDSIAVANPFIYFVDKVDLRLVGWIFIAVFGSLLFVRSFIKEKIPLFFFLVGLISFFFSLSVSSFFWQNTFLSSFVQFPFRFLSILLLSESFLAAYTTQKIKQKIVPAILLLLLLSFSAFAYLIPRAYDTNPESFYDTNVSTTTVQNEYMPKSVKELPTAYVSQRVKAEDSVISIIQQKGSKLDFSIQTKKQVNAIVSFVYFPGWIAYVDTSNVTITPSNPDGLLVIPIPKGQHFVKVRYQETTYHLLADLLSVIALGTIIGYILKKRYEK